MTDKKTNFLKSGLMGSSTMPMAPGLFTSDHAHHHHHHADGSCCDHDHNHDHGHGHNHDHGHHHHHDGECCDNPSCDENKK